MYAQTETSIAELNRLGKEHFEKGRYKEAEAVLIKAYSLCTPDMDQKEYASTLTGMAGILFKKGEFAKADSLLNESIQIHKQTCGEESIEYGEGLLLQSGFYLAKEEYIPAWDYIKKAAPILKKHKKKEPLKYAAYLQALGHYYLFTAQYEASLAALEECAAIRLAHAGDMSFEYASSRFTLGYYFLQKKELSKAEKEFTEAAGIIKNILGENNPDYATYLGSLGSVMLNMDKPKEAEEFFIKSAGIVSSYYGENHPQYAATLINLSFLYQMMGKYDEAEEVTKEALHIMNKWSGKRNNYYVTGLHLLAGLYQKRGLYEATESLYIESVALKKEMYGKKHPSVAEGLKKLCDFYFIMGNYDQAAPLFLETLDIITETIGTNTIEYNQLLMTYSAFHIYKGKPDLALEIAEEVVSALENRANEAPTVYMDAVYLLTTMIIQYNKFDEETEAILLDLKENYKSIYGKKHLQTLRINSDLATYYANNNDWEKAFSLYQESLDLLEEGQPLYSLIINTIGQHYLYRKEIEKALPYFTENLELLKAKIKQNFLFLSDEERFLFWKTNQPYIKPLQSFATQNQQTIRSLSGFSYDCELFTKSLLLNTSLLTEKTIQETNNKQFLLMWYLIKSTRNNITETENDYMFRFKLDNSLQLHLFLSGSEEEQLVKTARSLKERKEQITQLERDLFSSIKESLKEKHSSLLSWKTIQETLHIDEAAIEFITFPNIDFEQRVITDTLYYALLIRPGYEYPEMIPLGNHTDIQTALRLQKKDSSPLYSILWQPIEPFINGVKHIFIAPAGLLSNVSFAGLKKEGRYTGDEYIIHNLLSTKDIPALKSQRANRDMPGEIVLFGGIDFMSTSETRTKPKPYFDIPDINLTREMLDYMNLSRRGFLYLPGSGKEVKEIARYLQSLHWKTSLFTDREATETQFKSYSSIQSPKVIHISTHGFYFPKPPEKKFDNKDFYFLNSKADIYRLSDHPLMRSGLAFAGANQVWYGDDPQEDMDDGILTAYEISNMNLFNTELVVLSACNTGLGDIDHSEGVYGLQRAFRLAGVQTMIVSLWEVPDKETVELMTRFYKLWGSGLTKKEAFTQAQRDMRYKYPDQPEKWAAFVMIE